MSKSILKFKTKPNAIKNIINHTPITFACPNCNNKIQTTGNCVGSKITCSHCGIMIKLNDNGFNDGVNKLQKSFDKIFK